MIASVSYVKSILEHNDLRAKKKFGQNFLIDGNIVDKIARIACVEGCTVIEVGPGIGSLTEMLLKYAQKVYAYEIDEDMYNILNSTFKDNFQVELTDFLDVDLSSVPYKDERLCFASNLPYYVTTPILFKLFEADLNFEKITVMVQREVADRFKAKTGSEDYNALSIMVQYLYDVKLEMTISKSVFYPAPNVDSAVVSFTPKISRDREFEKGFFDFVKLCFAKRRKTLQNNLKELMSSEAATELIAQAGFKATVRAQELSLAEFLKLYEVYRVR